MISLKEYVWDLATILGTTPDALYERQRALVGRDLLGSGGGRGPGGGIRASAKSVAMLIIAVLAHSRGGMVMAYHVGKIAKATPVRRKRCPLTGQLHFVDALESLLVSRREVEISVSRTAPWASISWRDGATVHTTEFSGGHHPERAVHIVATLGSDSFLQIADDCRAIVDNTFEGRK